MSRPTRAPRSGQSFEDFMDRSAASLLRTAYLITWNLPEAEDAVQEALTRVAARWARVEMMEHPTAYARRIVVNCATTEARTRGHRTAVTRSSTPTTFDDLADDRFEQRLARIDSRSEILSLLAQLPRQQRVVLVLRYFEDMSESEIADHLSVPIGTVKSTASRALDKLRRSCGGAESEASTPLHVTTPLSKGIIT